MSRQNPHHFFQEKNHLHMNSLSFLKIVQASATVFFWYQGCLLEGHSGGQPSVRGHYSPLFIGHIREIQLCPFLQAAFGTSDLSTRRGSLMSAWCGGNHRDLGKTMPHAPCPGRDSLFQVILLDMIIHPGVNARWIGIPSTSFNAR